MVKTNFIDSVIRYSADVYVVLRGGRFLLVKLGSSILYAVAVKSGAQEVTDHLEKHYGKRPKDRN